MKLEITDQLENMQSVLNSSVAILNLPDMNCCEKNCKGCVVNDVKYDEKKRMSLEEIKEIISYFSMMYGTRIITINGRGDPFHPKVKEYTQEKIRTAFGSGMMSYVFTAGDNLDEEMCEFLAKRDVNVMISLFGNKFIDADFFNGKDYGEKEIVDNLRMLIKSMKGRSKKGFTNVGMNYVVSEEDLKNKKKVRQLKKAANKNGIFFVCNLDFFPPKDEKLLLKLKKFAKNNSDHDLPHSTFVDNRCQMGAGSSVTVDYDGTFFRCPYLTGEGDGNYFKMDSEERKKMVEKYIADREYSCVFRKFE
jgi:sulfatase maturation enzyme AslB (radical SAM superfamily)